MRSILLFGALSVMSMSVMAVSWQPIAITKTGTKLYVDKDSIMVNADNQDEVLYKSRLESASDGEGLKKGELLVATETINCATGTKTLFSLMKYNPAGQVTYRSIDNGRAINVVKVTPNTVYADAMKYLCPMIPSTQPENIVKLESHSSNKTLWSFVTQDDKVLVQVDDMTLSANTNNKMVAFTSKMTSKSNSSAYLSKGQYFVAKNLADCQKGTVARLYVSKYDSSGTQLSEERFSFNDIKYRIANETKISGDIQKYVCKSVL